MNGPKPGGFWTSTANKSGDMLLRAGQRYAVVTPFTDYDGDQHPVGESWIFLSQYFLPYDDGLSLFVSIDGSSEWHIRLQWRPEAQGQIIEHLHKFVIPA
jgi:hypothetical protein